MYRNGLPMESNIFLNFLMVTLQELSLKFWYIRKSEMIESTEGFIVHTLSGIEISKLKYENETF